VDDVREAKRLWRRNLRARLLAIPEDARARKSAQIAGFLRERLQRDAPGTVAVFAAMPEEPDLLELLDCPRTWVFPKVDGEELTFWAVRSSEDLIVQSFGLREPDPARCAPVAVERLEWILVPGLGFGRDGSRLGRGRGFYDRLLAQSAARTIGIAFEEQVEDGMPCEEWDRSVAEIVTDRGWLTCGP
jgi:5-formyltetrahydrofolate cyclo-ligase